MNNHPGEREPSIIDRVPSENPSKGYALSGKIMLSAIVILVAVVLFMVALHIYARWYLLRARRRELLRRRNHSLRHRAHLVFYVDNSTPAAPRGIDASVLNSLPTFLYSSKTHPEVPECAVCLSEFEENQKGRLLPKCNHSFHIECIDMWFHSHSTCPLCRSPVEPGSPVQSQRYQPDVVLSIDEPAATEQGSSSGFCSTCQHEEHLPSTSLGARRKGLDLVGVRIEVPTRMASEDELGQSSPASHGFRSPGARLLSLKRILSMNRRTSGVSPPSGVGTSCGSRGTESDIELGTDESTQSQSRAETPK